MLIWEGAARPHFTYANIDTHTPQLSAFPVGNIDHMSNVVPSNEKEKYAKMMKSEFFAITVNSPFAKDIMTS